ncbi:MAG: hypothetical protein U0822_03510 [Anaerolineae bacterium]
MGSIIQIVGNIFTYIVAVFIVIWNAMWFNTNVVDYVVTHPQSWSLATGVAFVAGVSTLIGNSASLFVNRVQPARFVAALAINGTMLIATWVIWAITLWALAVVFFDAQAGASQVVRLILLGAAPLAFGFLVLAPYIGPAIGIVLNVWSLLVVIVMARSGFWVPPTWGIVVCVMTGWIILFLMSRTIGQPVLGMRNRLWARITGTTDQVTTEDLMIAYMRGNLMSDSEGGENRP